MLGKNNKIMKKSYVILIVTALVLVTVIVLLANSEVKFTFQGIAPWAILLMVLAFGFYVGFVRLVRSKLRGEPPEDELSRKTLQRASSLSFYISIYLWLAIMYFSDKSDLETHAQVGMGILGMAVIFAICWLIYKLGGIRDA